MTIPPGIKPLTVSQITQKIKSIVESYFEDIWVEGEISNLRVPISGHYYFTLKDEFSQIKAVLFRSQIRYLSFEPADGLHVICRGRVTLYEQKGEYQIVVDYMEPTGAGAILIAFEKLKEKLFKEGLFDPAKKKSIPRIPRKVGIITSPSGAALRDILKVLKRRFYGLHIVIYPATVQGEKAPQEIIEGIRIFNLLGDVEVIVIARGGGSWEDLQAFNDEELARSIHGSRIPVISAVGHEMDYTIADFVADLRAPTPSAAAEMIVKSRDELKSILDSFEKRMRNSMMRYYELCRVRLSSIERRIVHPARRIWEIRLKIDELVERLINASKRLLSMKIASLNSRDFLLMSASPKKLISSLKRELQHSETRLRSSINSVLKAKRDCFNILTEKLDGLSPLNVLKRGYSITWLLPEMKIVRDSSDTRKGDSVRVRLWRGDIICKVEDVKE